MKLPKNGKVIVIDNEPKEAEPLLQVLGKNKIPHIYYTGDTDLLPNEGEPFDDIRLIFLDINLTHNAVNQAIVAQLNSTLRRIVKPGSPYIAAIWSNNQDAHAELIEDLFANRASDIAPISRVLLDKSDFFQYNSDGYSLDPERPNVIDELQQRIQDCLNDVDSARLLIEWENLVSNALDESIVGFSGITKNDSFWNNNLKHLFYKLAHAQLGKTIFNHDDNEIQRAALQTLTSSFNDKLEIGIANLLLDHTINISEEGRSFQAIINNATVKLVWNDFKYHLYINGTHKSQNKSVAKLIANNTTEESQIVSDLKNYYGLISPKLNAELLISKSPKINFHPGNVYLKKVVGRKKRILLKTYFPNIEDRLGTGEYKFKDLKGIKFVEVECSPMCDYSQSKRLRFRFLPGILYKNNLEVKFDENLDSIYKEIPDFQFKGEIYKLIFDYRLFKAMNKIDDLNVSEVDFIFRLKSELLIDIQSRISSHISRPGIITVS